MTNKFKMLFGLAVMFALTALTSPAFAALGDKWSVGDESVRVTSDNRLRLTKPVLTPRTSTTGFYASSTVVAGAGGFQVLRSSSYAQALGSDGPILVTAAPSISTRTVAGTGDLWPDGMQLTLAAATTHAIILQDAGTLTNSGLELGSATRTLSEFSRLVLEWDAILGKWVEKSYSAN